MKVRLWSPCPLLGMMCTDVLHGSVDSSTLSCSLPSRVTELKTQSSIVYMNNNSLKTRRLVRVNVNTGSMGQTDGIFRALAKYDLRYLACYFKIPITFEKMYGWGKIRGGTKEV